MKSSTLSDFRAKMKQYLKKIEEDKDILILHGPMNRDYVVLSLELFSSMEETAYLLSTPANAARLAEGIIQDKKGEILLKEIDIDSPQDKSSQKKTIRTKRKV